MSEEFCLSCSCAVLSHPLMTDLCLKSHSLRWQCHQMVSMTALIHFGSPVGSSSVSPTKVNLCIAFHVVFHMLGVFVTEEEVSFSLDFNTACLTEVGWTAIAVVEDLVSTEPINNEAYWVNHNMLCGKLSIEVPWLYQ
eukprot:scaffold28544_cov78-Attheya_sp.AAC.8